MGIILGYSFIIEVYIKLSDENKENTYYIKELEKRIKELEKNSLPKIIYEGSIRDHGNKINRLIDNIAELKDWFLEYHDYELEKVQEVLRELKLKVELVGSYTLTPEQFKYTFDDNYWKNKEKLDASSVSHTVKKEKTDALDSLLHGIDPAFLKTEKKEYDPICLGEELAELNQIEDEEKRYHAIQDFINEEIINASETEKKDIRCPKCGNYIYNHVNTGREWICPDKASGGEKEMIGENIVRNRKPNGESNSKLPEPLIGCCYCVHNICKEALGGYPDGHPLFSYLSYLPTSSAASYS